MVKKFIGDAKFSEFRQGTFGNGGQNIYVSKRGVVQRIHRFDVNQNGWPDAFFANGQEIDERPPLSLIRDPLGAAQRSEFSVLGAFAATTADLNGDGYDELIVANQSDSMRSDICSYIFWGGPEGFSEQRRTELYMPDCIGVAAADFDGDGEVEIAFMNPERIRIYKRCEIGFRADGFTDIEVKCYSIAAADLDGDGCAELYARMRDGAPRIFWGGKLGLSAENSSCVGEADIPIGSAPALTTAAKRGYNPGWRARIVEIDGRRLIFKPEADRTDFYGVTGDRRLELVWSLPVANAVMAAAGKLSSPDFDDLALAVCSTEKKWELGKESSWVFHGSAQGFSPERATKLSTCCARDIAMIDFGSGRASVAVAQGMDNTMFTTESLIFAAAADGTLDPAPHTFVTHNAVAVEAVRVGMDKFPSVVFVNNMGGRRNGDVPVYIYLNGPEGFDPSHRIELPGHSAVEMICADFNDDGFADILVANSAECAPELDPGSFVYYNRDGAGFDIDGRVALRTYRAHGCAVGDFFHSGYLDVALCGYATPELRIFRNGPEGFNPDPIIINLDPESRGYVASTGGVEGRGQNYDAKNWGEPRFIYTADFNGDGYLDLFIPQILATHSLILWGGPEGFSRANATLLPIEGACCARAADLNGNGYLDLVVGCYGSHTKKEPFDSNLHIFWGGPAGYRQDNSTVLPVHGADSLVIADFDGDGRFDIFATSYHNGRERDIDAYIYWNSPEGFSVSRRSRLFNHSGSGCMAVDFDRDGRIDLAVCHHRAHGSHIAESKIWYNGPDGFNPANTVKLPTIGPLGMVAGPAFNVSDGSEEEYLLSRPLEIPEGVLRLTELRLDAELQTETGVRLQLRMAADIAGLKKAPWFGASYGSDCFTRSARIDFPVGANRFIQYRLALYARNGGNSPRVSAVLLGFE